MQSRVLYVTSFSAFQIDLKFNDIVLATGTAFFTSVRNRILLVTNKHNVTGRNTETGRCLDERNAAVPNIMSVLIPITNQDGEGVNCSQWQSYDIPLYINENKDKPTWIEHPDPAVDLVGFKFSPPEINVKNLVLPSDGYDMPINVCSKVNVVGFPFGISTDNFPLWNTGYIASEPEIDINGKPLMYIDSRTRKGQSGSPVVKLYNPGETVYINDKSYMAKSTQIYLWVYIAAE